MSGFKIYCFLFILLSLTVIAEKCPGMGLYSEKFEGCVVDPLSVLPWATSQSYCQYLGGTLAVVDTPEKNAELVRLGSQQVDGYRLSFIGAYTKNNTFQWINGTVFNYNNFTEDTTPEVGKVVVVQIGGSGSDNLGRWFLTDKNASHTFSCIIPSCNEAKKTTLNVQEYYPGFIFYAAFNEWYLVSNTMADRSFAKRSCESLGGTLPIIMNAFQNSDVINVLKEADNEYPRSQPHHLLGASSDINGTWTWDDGTPVGYRNWAPGEPKYTVNAEMKIDVITGYWSSMVEDNAGFTCVLSKVPNFNMSQFNMKADTRLVMLNEIYYVSYIVISAVTNEHNMKKKPFERTLPTNG